MTKWIKSCDKHFDCDNPNESDPGFSSPEELRKVAASVRYDVQPMIGNEHIAQLLEWCANQLEARDDGVAWAMSNSCGALMTKDGNAYQCALAFAHPYEHKWKQVKSGDRA